MSWSSPREEIENRSVRSDCGKMAPSPLIKSRSLLSLRVRRSPGFRYSDGNSLNSLYKARLFSLPPLPSSISLRLDDAFLGRNPHFLATPMPLKQNLKDFVGYDPQVVAAASFSSSLSGSTTGLSSKVSTSFPLNGFAARAVS